MSSVLGTDFYGVIDGVPTFAEDPYPFYARARQGEPITFCPELNTWLVTRYEDVQNILLQTETFSSCNSLSFGVQFYPRAIEELMKGFPVVPMVFNTDGVDHVRLRGPLMKAFTSARVRALEPFTREAANKLVDEFIHDSHAEMMNQFAYPLALQVIHKILGMPMQDVVQTRKWINDWFMLMSTQLGEERQIECAQSTVTLQHYLARLIAERREKPQDDVISVLSHYSAADEEPLTETELIFMLQGLILPGHLNPTNMIGTGIQILLDDSSRWLTLSEHSEYIPQAVEEILRMDGPIRSFGRMTTQEVTVGGVTLPANASLLVIYGSGNRDEAAFAHADEFQLQRTSNHHLAFGYGAHYCIGSVLARQEGRVAFEILTSRLPHLRLAPDQVLTHLSTLNFRGYERLEVEW